MADIRIRDESPEDAPLIEQITKSAFLSARHAYGAEQHIVAALRKAGCLTISKVATRAGEVVGHVAISPIRISGSDRQWYGLGPISVLPDCQGRGIGSALAMDALLALSEFGAAGCVVLGDPRYYGRFGFRHEGALKLPGVPPEYFMAVAFEMPVPEGVVSYHEAFRARS